MRTYERTHPWLTFTVEMGKAPARLWLLLGEASSKCEHVGGVPLRPETQVRLHRIYLAKGVLATTAIEGNTLTEQQVLDHLEGKLQLPVSKEYLAREIDNIVEQCNKISKEILEGSAVKPLTRAEIEAFNLGVLRGLSLEGGVVPGQSRRHQAGVPGYRGCPPDDCDHLLDLLCEWLNGPQFEAKPGEEVAVAILKATLAHLYLVWIHPFGDGNGRTARLLELRILMDAGIPTPACHLLSNHYNETRSEYYRQLANASKSGGDVLPFVEYAVQGFVDGLREQIELIRREQLDAIWRNYVREKIPESKSASDIRRRALVLDLSRGDQMVPVAELNMISPRVAEAYAGKTKKTITRDINALIKMELVERSGGGVRAAKEQILAFLPGRRARIR
ncbi:MAG: Fic family protein [Thermoanaerobaculia bacterium]